MDIIHKWNQWNIITMIPFFFILFFINNTPLFISILSFTVIGILHHYFNNSYSLLILDCISIVSVFTVLTFLLHFHPIIKNMLLFLEFTILFLFLSFLVFSFRVSERSLLFFVSLIWFPVILFSLDMLSFRTIFLIVVSIFLYVWSICFSHKITWGVFHILCALTTFFVLYDLKFLSFRMKSLI